MTNIDTQQQDFRAEDHYAELFSHLQIMRKALKEIAAGDGVYGAQAHEYKQIARKALEQT